MSHHLGWLSDGSRVQTNFLSNPFLARHWVAVARLDGTSQLPVHHSIQTPPVGDALELVLPCILEDDA